MDFTFSDDQEALRGLAAQIFSGHAGVERVREVELSDDRFDGSLWRELAKANLLGIALPEDVGGSGLGLVEACIVLEEQGRRVAPVPLWPTLVSALAVAEHGDDELRARLLPGVVAGDTVLTVASSEVGGNDPLRPSVTATRNGDGWSLDGTKVAVPAAHVAARVLVPARVDDGLGVFVVDPSGPGIAVEPGESTNRELDALVTFDAAPVPANDVLGAPPADGRRIVEWIVDRALVALCALHVGVSEEAVCLAAEYTSQRHQFGRPLSTNQGVAMEVADAYIATEAMRVTLWQAAWRLSEGLDASQEVLVAKWWAASGGRRALHLTQHVHGGVGVDVDYPFHRYFLWGKQLETTLGGPSTQLARLGRAIAETST